MVFQSPSPTQKEHRKEKPEIHVFVLWRQFKYHVGVVLSISVEGSSFGVIFGLRQLRMGRTFGWSFHLNIQDSLDIMMPGVGVKLPSKQAEVIFFYYLYILDINPLAGV